VGTKNLFKLPQLKRGTKNKMNKSKAFTLIEVLTAMTIGILIIMAVYEVYNISYKSYKKNFASAELTQNARVALERMSRDLRQTTEILTNLPEDPGAGTPPSEIKFQDGHNFWPTSGQIQYITYYLSGTDLHRRLSHYTFTVPCETAPSITWVLWSTRDGSNSLAPECTDSDVVKAEKISSLEFWGVKVITINLATSDETSTYHFETKTLGRNIQ